MRTCNMQKRISAILCSLCCIVLTMPQGWCCWLVPLQCCGEVKANSCCSSEKTVETRCCCCQSSSCSEQEPQPGNSLPLKCAKCLHDTLKPSSPFAVELTLDFVTLLPVKLFDALELAALCSKAYLSGDSPPLHVLLCVWRC